MKTTGWIASTGINYLVNGREIRLEIGQAVPSSLVTENVWLVEQGWVEAGTAGRDPDPTPDPTPDPDPVALEAESG